MRVRDQLYSLMVLAIWSVFLPMVICADTSYAGPCQYPRWPGWRRSYQPLSVCSSQRPPAQPLQACAQYHVNALPVVDDQRRVVGLIDLQDLVDRGFDVEPARNFSWFRITND